MDYGSLEIAADWLREARDVVVFTGAGMSAESGIPTFRDDDGFWQRFPLEDFATWSGLIRMSALQPRRVAQFVHAVVEPIAAAKPNAGHRAVAELEHFVPVTVVTQNIDGLHGDAGNTIVHEVHGTLREVVTRRRRFVRLLDRRQLQQIARRLEGAARGWLTLPRMLLALRPIFGLGTRGWHRPNLVLFGDALCEPAWTRSLQAAEQCDCLIQVGCSGVVLPAAMIPSNAKAAGARIITIDPQAVDGDLCLRAKAAEALPQLVRTAFPGDA